MPQRLLPNVTELLWGGYVGVNNACSQLSSIKKITVIVKINPT